MPRVVAVMMHGRRKEAKFACFWSVVWLFLAFSWRLRYESAEGRSDQSVAPAEGQWAWHHLVQVIQGSRLPVIHVCTCTCMHLHAAGGAHAGRELAVPSFIQHDIDLHST